MGHFVHSFAEEVSATSLNDLQTTSLEWVTNAMSLQQLRKGKFIFFSSNNNTRKISCGLCFYLGFRPFSRKILRRSIHKRV